eukprot:7980048-Pyramimonas_sp.AAC.1
MMRVRCQTVCEARLFSRLLVNSCSSVGTTSTPPPVDLADLGTRRDGNAKSLPDTLRSRSDRSLWNLRLCTTLSVRGQTDCPGLSSHSHAAFAQHDGWNVRGVAGLVATTSSSLPTVKLLKGRGSVPQAYSRSVRGIHTGHDQERVVEECATSLKELGDAPTEEQINDTMLRYFRTEWGDSTALLSTLREKAASSRVLLQVFRCAIVLSC